jgi:hypothetical protein
MPNQMNTSKASRPICGTASLALPLGIATIEFIASRFVPEGNSGTLSLYVLAAYLLVASMIAGAILAILALVRGERWRALSFLTFALNSIAVVLLLKWLV